MSGRAGGRHFFRNARIRGLPPEIPSILPMFRILLAASAALATHATAAVILTETFDAAGAVNGSIVNWTKTGANLFGGIGTESSANHPGGVGSGIWGYFQTNETSSSGMYRSTGVNGFAGETITLTFDLGGNSTASGNLYTGVFTAALWDGNPTAGGTLLTTLNPVNPVAGATTPVTVQTTLSSNTTGAIYVQFNAGVTAPGSTFDQAIIDNVLVTQVPEPSVTLLGSLALLTLARRRRR